MPQDLRTQSKIVGEVQLHDRASRGETLSPSERAQLQEWYTQLDREEGVTLSPTVLPASHTTLQSQIDAALAELATVTQRIQAISKENAALRREIASLEALLPHKPTSQPA